jgi:hypothetical protein
VHSASDPEELALDYLEQWLAASQSEAPRLPVESPRLDPTLRAIEHLVRQHQDLFRRHKPHEKSPPD